MPRHRAAKCRPLPPWMSARADGRDGRFVQVGNSLLLSERFRALNANAQMLYLCASMESGGEREFSFPSSTMEKYHFTRSTACAALTELIAGGFVELVSSGKNTRTANVYKFSLRWKEP